MKKFAALLLASLMVLSLVSCGGTKTTTAAATTKAAEATTTAAAATTTAAATTEAAFDAKAICEGKTITICVKENARISDWKNNKQTKYIEETLGVNLEFTVFPSADYSDKLNAIVAAGDTLPDIVMAPGSAYKNWASEGALLELSKYYEDPNFSANILIASEGAGYNIGDYMKDGDGNIYGLPSLEQGYGMESWQRFWVYKPWLEQLGKEVPTTIDEFYEIAKLIATTDLDGDGDTTNEKAIIGAGFNTNSMRDDWFDPLMSAFVYAWDSNFFTVSDDGKVGLAYETEEWKEGLKYIKKFFDEGLIGDYVFTNTRETMEANLYSEKASVFSFTGWAYEGSDIYIRNDYTWTALTNAKGENGYSQYMPKLPSVGGVISADCENPDAAFLVCDLLCGEYLSFSTRYGEEGVHWAYWDQVLKEDVLDPKNYAAQGGDKYEIGWISSYADTTFWSSKETTDASWLQIGVFVRTAAQQLVRARQISAETEEDKIKIDNTTIDYQSKDAGIANKPAKVLDYAPLTADETAETAEILTTVNAYVEEMTAAFLTGKKDIDKEWDAFQAQLKTLGTETLVKDYQAGYDRVH